MQQADLAAGGLVGGVEDKAGAVESRLAVGGLTGRAGVGSATPDIRQADLLFGGGDERSGESRRKIPGGGGAGDALTATCQRNAGKDGGDLFCDRLVVRVPVRVLGYLDRLRRGAERK